MKKFFIVLSLLFSSHVFAAIDTYQFKNEAQEQQFRKLTAALRCPKCQNNSIADSNAMIAADMRLKVYELMQQGKNNQQIIDYMVARYGHFVTYEPPVTPATLILWILPALAVVTGAGIIVMRSRKERISLIDERPESLHQIDLPQVSYWVFIPGMLILIIVSVSAYWKAGNLRQVIQWQRIVKQTPDLLERVVTPNAQPLTMKDLEHLGLGLRTRLQAQPDNLEGWMMLGRIGMVLNNATTATQAFAHAYKLTPADDNVKLSYAEVLIRSGEVQDNLLGKSLLRELLKTDHNNLRALGLLAFNALEQQNYREAMDTWQLMLKVLPADDSRRAVIEESIKRAKTKIARDSIHPQSKEER